MGANLLADIAGAWEASLRGVWSTTTPGRLLEDIALIAGGRLSSGSSGG
ncbi:hypothetical protein [Nonomuraea sp. NPDC003201]